MDIKKDYCWRAEFKPVFTLKFTPVEHGVECRALADEKFKRVGNPYLAFYLNAAPKSLASPQNKNLMAVTLPEGPIEVVDVSSPTVEKVITTAYIGGDPQGFSGGPLSSTIEKISRKVNGGVYVS